MARKADGSAGDADYGVIARTYTDHRRPDPRIASFVHAALGDARTVLNVGAGAGSYEPADRKVTPVEPSSSMRARRPADLPEAVNATAESLPFPDGSFEAAMTTFSVHQWSDLPAGLAELRRVTDGPVAVLTCDPDLVRRFWLYEYAPQVLDTEARRYPTTSDLAGGGWADAPRSPGYRSPSTARTVSTRPTTGGRRRCWIPRPDRPARRGASSRRRSTNASTRTCPAPWTMAHGIETTATFGRLRNWRVPSSCWSPFPNETSGRPGSFDVASRTFG
ncbi:class I SAM-dependent methyltransferase [Nocardiopsis listeri]|uniref:class I SAM-dependent methyltransferase n=1 Tax=Nocardiopsis listeri TaxID=53440 RepID=UPI000B002443|nr:class I SAM-dependent methyltransferase [Nocardiopsis listeri]